MKPDSIAEGDSGSRAITSLEPNTEGLATSEYFDRAKAAAEKLFKGPISAGRFREWVRNDSAGLGFKTYAFGEIFWDKAIGRPQTASLSEGFTIEAWHDEKFLAGQIGGAAAWTTVRAPHYPSWWDGHDDDKFWRVSFMVPDLHDGRVTDGIHNRLTYIVPRLVGDVSWWPRNRPWSLQGRRAGHRASGGCVREG